MTKITAEQVLADFESLSRDQKQLVSSQLLHLKKSALARARHTKLRKNVSWIEEPTASFEIEPSSYSFPEISIKQVSTKERSVGSYPLLRDGELIEFEKGYLRTHEDLSILKSLVGSQAVMESLNQTKRIDDKFVENLIEKCEGEFFVDRGKRYLFATTNQLFESKFGQLEAVSPLDTLKKYGLQTMEEANEKNYSKI